MFSQYTTSSAIGLVIIVDIPGLKHNAQWYLNNVEYCYRIKKNSIYKKNELFLQQLSHPMKYPVQTTFLPNHLFRTWHASENKEVNNLIHEIFRSFAFVKRWKRMSAAFFKCQEIHCFFVIKRKKGCYVKMHIITALKSTLLRV